MKFKVAVVQFEINQFQPEENLKKAEKFIQEASGKADIIIFPEDFLTGPVMKIKEYVDFDRKYVKHFQNLAKRYSIDIVSGSIIEEERGGWYNVSYYIDKTGKIRGRYKKVNLWIPERLYLTPGNEVSVFNTKFGKVGLVVCWDLAFPEIFRHMVKIGVKIVFCPSYWSLEDSGATKHGKDAEIKFVNSTCITRAFENNIILVYCNSAGYDKLLGKYSSTKIGQSQITVPFKGVINSFNHNKEEMFIQEVDTSILKDAERAYKIRKDLKTRII